MTIRTERVYDHPEGDDQERYLVERLWPRGVKKEALHVNAWLKDVAPSTELRQWFGHDPAKWEEFKRRYFAELDQEPAAWQPLLAAVKKGDVVLLYSAHDQEHNNALALKEYLEARS